MNAKNILLLLAAALILPSPFCQNTAFATDTTLSVRQNDATCLQTAAPPCFPTIQSAVNYADNLILASGQTGTATFSIQVEAGTRPYNEAITLKTGITALRGTETARTVLNNGDNGAAIRVTAGNPIIANFFFQNAQTGVAVTNNASATIENNIFNLGLDSTAIEITQTTAQPSILNNTFYVNKTAVSSSTNCLVNNNIFLKNTAALTPLNIFTATNVKHNDFFLTTRAESDPLNGQPTGDAQGNISSDPLFVNVTAGDFHLRAGSPCINAGVEGNIDMGAYGASLDTIPFPVAGVRAELASATSISVTWTPNLSHQIVGYRVWYGRTSGGPYDGNGAAEGPSPISVPTGTAASSTLRGLTTTVAAPASPVLNEPSVQNASLVLSWSAVPGATGYRVYYGVDDQTQSRPTTSIDNIRETSYTLTGLTNNVHYKVAVSAIAQAAYYVAVTAVNTTITGTARDVKNESIYSTEAIAGTGEIRESPLSNVIVDYPEAVVPYPNLTNSRQGCFIATAAYGYYGAPEVRALRDFRDRYLLTTRAGRAFVSWYYEHGPVGAAYLDAHPAWKPLVRAALLPAVGAALFLTKTPLFGKILFILCMLSIALVTAFRFSVKRNSSSGGVA